MKNSIDCSNSSKFSPVCNTDWRSLGELKVGTCFEVQLTQCIIRLWTVPFDRRVERLSGLVSPRGLLTGNFIPSLKIGVIKTRTSQPASPASRLVHNCAEPVPFQSQHNVLQELFHHLASSNSLCYACILELG